MTFHPEEFVDLKEKIPISTPKLTCCKNDQDYRITYLMGVKHVKKEAGLCKECLSKEHYKIGLHDARCIRCRQDLTDEVYRIMGAVS